MKSGYVCIKFNYKYKKQNKMKKTTDQKKVLVTKQKFQNGRRLFIFLPELHLPFGLNFMPDYPLVFDSRSNLNKIINKKRSL